MKKIMYLLIVSLLIITTPVFAQDDVVKVPVLMYHAVDTEYNGSWTINKNNLEEQIKIILENGYTPIHFKDLIEYVDKGTALPEKPVCITFDDGYLDNFINAFPIFQKYNCKATIFIVGSSVGKKTYKDTEYIINEHFDFAHASEMVKSGLIDIQSHTHDMHQAEEYENSATVQKSVLRIKGESMIEYVRKFVNDFKTSKKDIKDNLGYDVNVLSYPGGCYDNMSEILLKNMGVRATITTTPGMNYVKKGVQNSLYKMKRYNIEGNITPDRFLQILSGE